MWSDNSSIFTQEIHGETHGKSVTHTCGEDIGGGGGGEGRGAVCGVITMHPEVGDMPDGGMPGKGAKPSQDLQKLHVHAL